MTVNFIEFMYKSLQDTNILRYMGSVPEKDFYPPQKNVQNYFILSVQNYLILSVQNYYEKCVRHPLVGADTGLGLACATCACVRHTVRHRCRHG